MSDTLPRMFLDRVKRAPEGVAMHSPVAGGWRTTTWAQAERAVAAALDGLDKAGVVAGDRVAILGNPHPAWLTADLATLAAGAITVGIYPTLLPESVRYIVGHAGCTLLLVESEAELQRLGCVDGRVAGVAARVWHADAIATDAQVQALHAAVDRVDPDQLCTLIYTSGTTGEPKGAMITHRAMVAVCEASREALPLEGPHRSIVYLPLAHSLQRMAAYRSFLDDIEAWWCPRLEDLPATIGVARPTVLVAVPRVLEKMQARIEGTVGTQSATVQRLFGWAVRTGRRRIARTGTAPRRERWEEVAAERLVLRRVRDRLGGLRFVGVGGAALNVETARFFQAVGIEVLEAWGLTETCAPATLNRPGKTKLGTVGTPLAGVEIRLLDDGEVLVRGPGLFSGYWRDEPGTRAVMVDGWFCTGDIGEIDAEGFLRIIDRKKELIVTAGGKNIAPVPIERKLERGGDGAPGIGQAIVIGSERPYLIALLAEDPDAPPQDREAFARARIAAVNADLPSFERIRRWAWVPPLTIEDGLLTPTLKPKRRAILERHKAVIDGLYSG